MREFRVTWVIDVVAKSHREAATIARTIQLDASSTATMFHVKEFDAGDEGRDIDVKDVRSKE